MTNNNMIEPTFENLRTILLEDIMKGIFYGQQDEEKVCTIVNRTQYILDALSDGDEITAIDKKVAARLLHQVKGTYEDAVYTAQRRAGAILNELRGL